MSIALDGATFRATIALGGARGNIALGGARENFGRFRWGRQHALFARRHVRGTAPLLVASVLALPTVVTHDLSHSHTESAVLSRALSSVLPVYYIYVLAKHHI